MPPVRYRAQMLSSRYWAGIRYFTSYGTWRWYSQWTQSRNADPGDIEQETLRAVRYRAAIPPTKYTGQEFQPMDKGQEYHPLMQGRNTAHWIQGRNIIHWYRAGIPAIGYRTGIPAIGYRAGIPSNVTWQEYQRLDTGQDYHPLDNGQEYHQMPVSNKSFKDLREFL